MKGGGHYFEGEPWSNGSYFDSDTKDCDSYLAFGYAPKLTGVVNVVVICAARTGDRRQ